MNYEVKYVNAGGLRWRYLAVGSGPELWIAFHGFGHTAENLLQWAKKKQDTSAILIFDLPWHGENEGKKNNEPITREDVSTLLEEVLKEQIDSPICVFGYSFGARLAMESVAVLKEKVAELVLAAPDGLKNATWFSLGARTAIGRILMRFWVNSPKLFFTLVAVAEKLGLVNKSLALFVKREMGTAEQRRQVANSWASLRDLPSNIEEISAIINQNNLTCHVYTGKYDRVIPHGRVEGFLKAVKSAKSTLLDTGHNGLLARI